jgi:hypothetical protein
MRSSGSQSVIGFFDGISSRHAYQENRLNCDGSLNSDDLVKASTTATVVTFEVASMHSTHNQHGQQGRSLSGRPYRKLAPPNLAVRLKLLCITIFILLAGCDSLATDCLDLAPPGIWTKIQSPGEEIVGLFNSSAADSTVLWFKSSGTKFGMCHGCAAPSEHARSFQIADTQRDKLDNIVEQECVR